MEGCARRSPIAITKLVRGITVERLPASPLELLWPLPTLGDAAPAVQDPSPCASPWGWIWLLPTASERSWCGHPSCPGHGARATARRAPRPPRLPQRFACLACRSADEAPCSP